MPHRPLNSTPISWCKLESGLPVSGGVGVMPGAGVGFTQLGFLQQGLAGSISNRQEDGKLG